MNIGIVNKKGCNFRAQKTKYYKVDVTISDSDDDVEMESPAHIHELTEEELLEENAANDIGCDLNLDVPYIRTKLRNQQRERVSIYYTFHMYCFKHINHDLFKRERDTADTDIPLDYLLWCTRC